MPNLGPTELIILAVFLLILIALIVGAVVLFGFLRSITRKNNANAEQLTNRQNPQSFS
ncbi:hypothetical protein QVA66_07600 [Staphylococcus chromogenes]|nr:hypothetical protein [Staphylococcus chromogenes]